MRVMTFEEKGTVIRSISKPSCCNNGTGPYLIGGYINTLIISGQFRSKIKMPNLYAAVLPHEWTYRSDGVFDRSGMASFQGQMSINLIYTALSPHNFFQRFIKKWLS